jgi:DNA-binding response OmpR family regulator
MEILIIEDDVNLTNYLKKELENRGHYIVVAQSAQEVIEGNLHYNREVIIMDLLLKNGRGENLIKKIRKDNATTPILVLSSLTKTENKLELFKLGADDYMTKPFSIEELAARLDVLHKRTVHDILNEKEVHKKFIFYWKQNKVIQNGKEILLTSKENKLLKLLVRNNGKVVTSEEIIKYVWNVDPGYHSNILQSLVRHLREKIESKTKKELIKNIHGVGYMLKF